MIYRCYLWFTYQHDSYTIYRDIEIPIIPSVGMYLINLKEQWKDSEDIIEAIEYDIASQQVGLHLGTAIYNQNLDIDFDISEINLYYSQWKFEDGQNFKIKEIPS